MRDTAESHAGTPVRLTEKVLNSVHLPCACFCGTAVLEKSQGGNAHSLQLSESHGMGAHSHSSEGERRRSLRALLIASHPPSAGSHPPRSMALLPNVTTASFSDFDDPTTPTLELQELRAVAQLMPS
eukprot:6310093-Amphidinium_carterae.1